MHGNNYACMPKQVCFKIFFVMKTETEDARETHLQADEPIRNQNEKQRPKMLGLCVCNCRDTSLP